jgi:hypothetical protein
LQRRQERWQVPDRHTHGRRAACELLDDPVGERRDRDDGHRGAGLLEHLLEVVQRAEPRKPLDGGAAERPVVVEETDRREAEGRHALQVAGQGLAGGSGADEHGVEAKGLSLSGEGHRVASGVGSATASTRAVATRASAPAPRRG